MAIRMPYVSQLQHEVRLATRISLARVSGIGDAHHNHQTAVQKAHRIQPIPPPDATLLDGVLCAMNSS